MPWTHIETGQIAEKPLDLYCDGSDYMLRVGGLELMNSRWHRSEVRLADAAAPYLRPGGHVLIGGLGIGFTLAAFVEKYGDSVDITVAEKSADVIRWFEQYFKNRFFKSKMAAQILDQDVRDLIGTDTRFDVIVLDVDNGPEPLSTEGNAGLYTVDGLKQMKNSLAPPGAMLLWSGFRSDRFLLAAREAGFVCSVQPIQVGHHDHEHYVYSCTPDSRV